MEKLKVFVSLFVVVIVTVLLWTVVSAETKGEEVYLSRLIEHVEGGKSRG